MVAVKQVSSKDVVTVKLVGVTSPVIELARPIPCTLNSWESTLLSQFVLKNVSRPFM